jgi:hypothetical protein
MHLFWLLHCHKAKHWNEDCWCRVHVCLFASFMWNNLIFGDVHRYFSVTPQTTTTTTTTSTTTSSSSSSSSCCFKKVKKKYRYPCNRPWRPIGLWEIKAPHLLDNRLTDGGEVFSLTRLPSFTPKEIGTHSVGGWVDPRAIEEKVSIKRSSRWTCAPYSFDKLSIVKERNIERNE